MSVVFFSVLFDKLNQMQAIIVDPDKTSPACCGVLSRSSRLMYAPKNEGLEIRGLKSFAGDRKPKYPIIFTSVSLGIILNQYFGKT